MEPACQFTATHLHHPGLMDCQNPATIDIVVYDQFFTNMHSETISIQNTDTHQHIELSKPLTLSPSEYLIQISPNTDCSTHWTLKNGCLSGNSPQGFDDCANPISETPTVALVEKSP